MSRSELVINYLKNPYNLGKDSIAFDSPFTSKSQNKTRSRKFFQPFRTQNMPKFQSTNYYLMKTNAEFRISQKKWEQELTNCLRSQKVFCFKIEKILLIDLTHTYTKYLIDSNKCTKSKNNKENKQK
ncbi:hypothetical protein pb186bvf_018085 [Paramecium bursaria]